MTWFGVHPILALFFMALGGTITCFIVASILFVRQRVSFNYQPSRRKVRSTYIRK